MRSLFFQAFLTQTLVRFFLIWNYPHNFALDAFQRWAGKEHLLIRDWLPATQLFIYISNSLGFGIMGTRFVLSLLGALAVASTSLIVAHLFDKRAGLIFIGFSFFAPFLTWSSTLYQEGTFLALSMSALALALYLPKNRLWIADIIAGSVALSRYEGWPFVMLYLLWRKDLKAGIALWGMGTWIGIKILGISSFEPSPINYADWEGIDERFDWNAYLKNCILYVQLGLQEGAGSIWIGALFGLKKALQKDLWLSLLLLLLLCSQFAAILGWIAGLETAILRMLVIPTFLLAIFFSGLPRKWLILPLFSIGFAFLSLKQTFRHIMRNTHIFRFERQLAKTIENCPDCRILVRPRKGMGTRNRHDGCEVLQGVSSLMHPNDFVCDLWENNIDRTLFTHQAKWLPRRRRYRVFVTKIQ